MFSRNFRQNRSAGINLFHIGNNLPYLHNVMINGKRECWWINFFITDQFFVVQKELVRFDNN